MQPPIGTAEHHHLPPLGAIAMKRPHRSSSRAGASKIKRLQNELWCEAERRGHAERELRNVQVHGRSRPPWVGDSAGSGYARLSAETLMQHNAGRLGQ